MIGNMLREPAATHNHFLPTITVMSLLDLQDHWCFWSFGHDPYQLLPIVTTSPHAVIGDSGASETASTKHYQHLPTY